MNAHSFSRRFASSQAYSRPVVYTHAFPSRGNERFMAPADRGYATYLPDYSSYNLRFLAQCLLIRGAAPPQSLIRFTKHLILSV